MIADIYKGKIGVYAPDLIASLEDHEVQRENSLCTRIIYDDGSWVEIYGNEIVDYKGSENDKQMDPADAYFEGFK